MLNPEEKGFAKKALNRCEANVSAVWSPYNTRQGIRKVELAKHPIAQSSNQNYSPDWVHGLLAASKQHISS